MEHTIFKEGLSPKEAKAEMTKIVKSYEASGDQFSEEDRLRYQEAKARSFINIVFGLDCDKVQWDTDDVKTWISIFSRHFSKDHLKEVFDQQKEAYKKRTYFVGHEYKDLFPEVFGDRRYIAWRD